MTNPEPTAPSFSLPPEQGTPTQMPPPKKRGFLWLYLILGFVGLCVVLFGILLAIGNSPEVQRSVAATAEAATAVQIQAAVAATADTKRLFDSAEEVLNDDFTDPDSGWKLSSDELRAITIEDGVYRVQWKKNGGASAYSLLTFTDFIADADCKLVKGGDDASCGIVFGVGEEEDSYTFSVSPKSYSLVLSQGGKNKTLLEGKPSDAFKSDANNKLRVIREGKQIRMYLNGQLLDSNDDTTIPSGGVGIYSECTNVSGGVQVDIDSFVIWKLP